MEIHDLAVAQIVSAILSKPEVLIGADPSNGIYVRIKKTSEISAIQRSTMTLDELIVEVRKALD